MRHRQKEFADADGQLAETLGVRLQNKPPFELGPEGAQLF